MNLYDQQHIQSFYNNYAEQETLRWDKSIVEQVKFAVHLHYLQTHISTEDDVLELGAGTGMFTRHLARMVSDMVVTDLSPVQLRLNQERAYTEGYAARIRDFAIVDICNLQSFADASFDKIICYGGPLSYVFEQKKRALQEMKRVLRPKGILLFSVMNLWGTVHEYLQKIILPLTVEDNEKVLQSGNLHPSSFTDSDHHCHMFRSEELRTDIQLTGFELLQLSASNCLSALRAAALEDLQQDEEKWRYFLDLEIRACASPGMVESGTHLIAVCQKP